MPLAFPISHLTAGPITWGGYRQFTTAANPNTGPLAAPRPGSSFTLWDATTQNVNVADKLGFAVGTSGTYDFTFFYFLFGANCGTLKIVSLDQFGSATTVCATLLVHFSSPVPCIECQLRGDHTSPPFAFCLFPFAYPLILPSDVVYRLRPQAVQGIVFDMPRTSEGASSTYLHHGRTPVRHRHSDRHRHRIRHRHRHIHTHGHRHRHRHRHRNKHRHRRRHGHTHTHTQIKCAPQCMCAGSAHLHSRNCPTNHHAHKGLHVSPRVC